MLPFPEQKVNTITLVLLINLGSIPFSPSLNNTIIYFQVALMQLITHIGFPELPL